MYSVDIDVGGTLTDGLFSDGHRVVCSKVDSTPHDLTVCLFECLTHGATQLGFGSLSDFLEQVALLRWSTTITSNVLAELRGPKLGLLVSRGHETDLYGADKRSLLLGRLIDEKNVAGINGGGDDAILHAVRSLLENGVRRICISLKGALQHPEQELHLKRVIDEQYPDHYLGSVPVLTGTDICQNPDDMTRTYYALINAYTHSALAATLFKAEDELRYTQGYSRAFLISHINGGVAGVAKTRAIDTLESGPILGIYGTSYLAKMYALKDVVAMDVGGTTAKIGVIQNGEPVYSRESDLFGIPVRVRLPYLRSIALGGGSVVSVRQNSIQLGPESMGSFPGPACYSLGGDKATLTDAFVTGGFIDPNYFLGGSKPLDLAAAQAAIKARVARPCNLSLEAACSAVIDTAHDMVAAMIAGAGGELKQDLSNHTLFAYGGNGGLFACGVAQRVGIKRVYLFDLGPVFSAFGSSVSDICHVYERSLQLLLRDGADVGPLNGLLEEMHGQGIRDLLGEGIAPENVACSVELEFSRQDASPIFVPSPHTHFGSVAEIRRAADLPAGDWTLHLARMRVKKAMAKPALVMKESAGLDAAAAILGTRRIIHGGGRREASLYRWETLKPGNVVPGPAILESANSTYLIPPGWTLEMDHYGNACLVPDL